MEDQCESAVVLQGSSQKLGSDIKLIGERKKRICEFGQQNDELSRKRVKMRDLCSLTRSDETTSHIPKCSDEVQPKCSDEVQSSGVETFQQATKDSLKLKAKMVSQSLDLNASVCMEDNSGVENHGEEQSQGKFRKLNENKYKSARGICLDLNEDVCSTVDVSQSSKSTNTIGRKDVSECGSSTVPFDNKDPLSVWKEMKQNGFLSSSREGLSMQTRFCPSSKGGASTPKKRGRKKGDVLKKRMELARKEQVDRFAKIAAPSGLLNGLNPGIINHVRNRKQVHSIIEALVRSEKHENCESDSKEASHNQGATKRFDRNKEDVRGDFGFNRSTHSSSSVPPNNNVIMHNTGYSLPMHEPYFPPSADNRGDGGGVSLVEPVHKDDGLYLKLASSLDKASENLNSLCLDEPASHNSASILSLKAASVASQWLDLLQQDIKGRLQALRRSKKRVRAVITTELPFLMMKEFSCNENDPSLITSSTDGVSGKVNADAHRSKWSALFGQMDEALSEEERQLESWLSQVKEMQQHCDCSLQPDQVFHPQQSGAARTDSRSGKMDNSEKELAVRAAAASIYSTSNFLSSMENIPCF